MELKPHWATHRMDPTKCAILTRCPREFFFAHWLGWHPDTDSHHLLVGQAFHSAMEVLMRGGSVQRAQATYLEEWGKKCPGEVDLGAKSPDNMIRAIEEYASTYCTDRWTVDNDMVEVPGMVSFAEGRLLYINIDVVVTDHQDRKVWIVDHKTSSSEDRLFAEKWQLSFQMSAYIFAMWCVLSPDLVGGAIVNGIVLRKPATQRGKGNGFQRAYITRDPDAMAAWYADASALYDDLDRWTSELLEVDSQDANYMLAFPRRTWNCERYARMCPYHAICAGCSNPLRLAAANVVPSGFRLGWWNPAAHEETTAMEPPKEEMTDERK